MTVLREQQTIKFETTEDENPKTGEKVITSVAITSSNGLYYKITNRKNSKSKTHLHLSYKRTILMNGDINSSAYRADSFANCKDHILFKLSTEELDDFFKNYDQNRVGTLFVKGDEQRDYSYVWIKRKLHVLYEDETVNMVVIAVAHKHKTPTVMEKFISQNSKSYVTMILANLKNNLSLFELYEDRLHVVFKSTYNSETNIGTFHLVDGPMFTVPGLDAAKYKIMLNDHLIKWVINHPKAKFETIVNDYGFTDDMSYNQVKKLLRMIKI